MLFFLADIDLGDVWKLEFNSPSLAKLFNFKDIVIAKYDSASLCGNLLEAIYIEAPFKRLRETFSNNIKVRRNFLADPQKDEFVICVLEVDVVFRNDKITVVERVCKTLFKR